MQPRRARRNGFLDKADVLHLGKLVFPYVKIAELEKRLARLERLVNENQGAR